MGWNKMKGVILVIMMPSMPIQAIKQIHFPSFSHQFPHHLPPEIGKEWQFKILQFLLKIKISIFLLNYFFKIDFFSRKYVMKNIVKNHQKLIWNVQKGFDFETDKVKAHFKM